MRAAPTHPEDLMRRLLPAGLPAVVLLSAVCMAPSAAARQDDHLVIGYSHGDTGAWRIARLNVNGGGPMTILDRPWPRGPVTDLYYSEPWVYARIADEIVRFGPDGKAIEFLMAGLSEGDASSIARAGSAVYWSEWPLDRGPWIRRLDLSTGEIADVYADGTPILDLDAHVSNMGVDLAFVQNGSVFLLESGESTPRLLYDSGGGSTQPGVLKLDLDFSTIVAATSNAILSITATGPPSTVFDFATIGQPTMNVTALQIDPMNSWVYWAGRVWNGQSLSGVWRVRRDGTGFEEVWRASTEDIFIHSMALVPVIDPLGDHVTVERIAAPRAWGRAADGSPAPTESTVRAVIKAAGDTPAGTEVVLALTTPGLRLSPGETRTRTLGALYANQRVELDWRLQIDPAAFGEAEFEVRASRQQHASPPWKIRIPEPDHEWTDALAAVYFTQAVTGPGGEISRPLVRFGTDGSFRHAVALPYLDITAAAFDPVDRRLYYAAWTVRSSTPAGADTRVVFSPGETVRNLAIDSYRRWLYYDGWGSLRRMALDGSSASVLASGEAKTAPVAVDETSGRVYWAEQSLTDRPTLQRANASLSDRCELDSRRLHLVEGLAFDGTTERLYIADRRDEGLFLLEMNTFEECDRFAPMRLVTPPRPGGPAGSLAIDSNTGTLYWAESDTGPNDVARERVMAVSVAGGLPYQISEGPRGMLPPPIALAHGGGRVSYELRPGQTPTLTRGAGGGLEPETFRLPVTLANLGDIDGTSLQVELSVPSGLVVDGAAAQSVNLLEAGLSTDLEWTVSVTDLVYGPIPYTVTVRSGATVLARASGSISVPEPPVAAIYWAESPGNWGPAAVLRAGPDGADVQTVVSTVNLGGLALDSGRGRLYWGRSDQVRESDFAGQGERLLASCGALPGFPCWVDELTLNPSSDELVAGLLYTVGAGSYRTDVGFADLASGSGWEDEAMRARIDTDADSTYLAFDPGSDTVFWTRYWTGGVYARPRAPTGGGARTVVPPSHARRPQGLTFDAVSGSLLFIDEPTAGSWRIRRVSTGGSGLESLYECGACRPVDLAWSGGESRLYWTDNLLDRILAGDVTAQGLENVRVLVQRPASPRGDGPFHLALAYAVPGGETEALRHFDPTAEPNAPTLDPGGGSSLGYLTGTNADADQAAATSFLAPSAGKTAGSVDLLTDVRVWFAARRADVGQETYRLVVRTVDSEGRPTDDVLFAREYPVSAIPLPISGADTEPVGHRIEPPVEVPTPFSIAVEYPQGAPVDLFAIGATNLMGEPIDDAWVRQADGTWRTLTEARFGGTDGVQLWIEATLRRALSVGTVHEDAAIPSRTEFVALFPNPTLGPTTADVSLSTGGRVRIRLYDLLGREVFAIRYEELPAGVHRIPIDLSRLAAGMYVARIEAASGSASRLLAKLR